MKKFLKIGILIAVLMICGLGILLWYRFDRCMITQFQDTTGSQGMFYTIENDGKLIVIDGGNPGNAEYVSQVIEQFGGHVDAWILSHPHPDHIGAFNELYEMLQDKVDAIYTPAFDYDAYLAKSQPWDEFEYYEKYLKLTKDSDKVHYVHAGEVYTVCGLQIKVISAYEDYVDARSRDLCNDGSMLFKVTHRKESMLFCSDVGISLSDLMLAEYGEELKSEYLQMGHHGYGGLSDAFYTMVAPRTAFFDAPEWLMHPSEENSNLNTPEKIRLMESLGAEIFYYEGAPHRFQLK